MMPLPRWLAFIVPCTALLMMASMLISSGSASAESATGTWTQTSKGLGYVVKCGIGDSYYDVKLTLNPGGGGTITTKLVRVANVAHGFEADVAKSIGRSDTGSVRYTTSGSRVTLTMGGEQFALTLSGGKLSGSGSYSHAQTGETMSWSMSLTGGGGGMSSASLPVGALAIGAAAMGLYASFLPLKGGKRSSLQYPSQPHVYHGKAQIGTTYSPGSESRTVELEPGPPEAGTSWGGAGLSWPVLLDQSGNPLPPRQYQAQHGPMCKNERHKIPCQALFPYRNQLEPGSWFCNECYKEGFQGGYPWGTNPPPR